MATTEPRERPNSPTLSGTTWGCSLRILNAVCVEAENKKGGENEDDDEKMECDFFSRQMEQKAAVCSGEFKWNVGYVLNQFDFIQPS